LTLLVIVVVANFKTTNRKIETALLEPTQQKTAIHMPENQVQSWRDIK